MAGEASGAFGELYAVTSSTITTGTAGVFSKWIAGLLGLADPHGFCCFEADDLNTWSATGKYPRGAAVSHDGKDWTASSLAYTAYNAATTYTAAQTCYYGGYDWTCILESTGHMPELGSIYWVTANLNQEPDTGIYWTVSAAPRGDRIVVKDGGKGIYRVSARARFTGNAASVFTWKVYKSGAAIAKMAAAVTAVSTVQHLVVLEGLVELQVGDYLELCVAGSVGSETVVVLAAYLLVERIFEG